MIGTVLRYVAFFLAMGALVGLLFDLVGGAPASIGWGAFTCGVLAVLLGHSGIALGGRFP